MNRSFNVPSLLSCRSEKRDRGKRRNKIIKNGESTSRVRFIFTQECYSLSRLMVLFIFEIKSWNKIHEMRRKFLFQCLLLHVVIYEQHDIVTSARASKNMIEDVAVNKHGEFSGECEETKITRWHNVVSCHEFFSLGFLGVHIQQSCLTFRTTARLLTVGLMQNASGCLPTR